MVPTAIDKVDGLKAKFWMTIVAVFGAVVVVVVIALVVVVVPAPGAVVVVVVG
ncbi:MAG TPA: hypothetical protein VFA11_15170 [Acidimicrobiales bacterium]|nr:hypothetical protein [Acidimicrobiales bacterium]